MKESNQCRFTKGAGLTIGHIRAYTYPVFENKRLLRILTIVIAVMVAFSMVAFYSLFLF